MTDGNGVTRREFERLETKVSRIDERGSRGLDVVREQMREAREDIRDIRATVANVNRALWGLASIIIVATVGIIATLLSHP